MKKALTKPLAIICMISVLAVTFSGCGVLSRHIDPNDYFYDEIEFFGTDGYGSVKFDSGIDLFDYESMYADMIGAKKGSKTEAGIADEITINECVKVELSSVDNENGSYKNGDEIEVVVSLVPQRLNEMQGVVKKISKRDTEVTRKYSVSGLEEQKKINAFDAVKGVYYVDGYVKVELKPDYKVELPNGTLFSNFSADSEHIRLEKANSVDPYDIEKHIFIEPEIRSFDEYKKGMKVNLELSCELNEYVDAGVEFTSRTQEFELKLPMCPKRASQISKTDLDFLKSLADEEVNKTSELYNTVEHKPKFEGMYLASDQDYDLAEVAIVYSGIFNQEQQYYVCCYDDIITDGNNNLLFKMSISQSPRGGLYESMESVMETLSYTYNVEKIDYK